jgi:ribosomal protein S6
MSTTEGQAERTVYEIGYLVLPSIPEDSLDSLVSKINNTFEKAGGVRIDGEAPFMHDLAYEMGKQVGARNYVVHEAYLGWVKFELEPEKVEAVKHEVEGMEEILRALLIKAPRETHFSFAAAREAAQKAFEDAEAAKNAPVEAPAEAAQAPAEVVE